MAISSSTSGQIGLEHSGILPALGIVFMLVFPYSVRNTAPPSEVRAKIES